jgi:hypothetical protein
MGSLGIVYDAEGDILDVGFRLTGEKPRRGIELHDSIKFANFGLRISNFPLPCRENVRVRDRGTEAGLLKLLKSDPVKRFLVCVNEKEFRFRVADPGVRAGAAA